MNMVLIISVSAWAAAQVIKVLLVLIKDKHLNFRYFVSSGGMPSAHSATVCALATAVARLEGFSSVAFGITAILAIIVMYDSAGVRQAVSRQSTVLNRIVKELQVRRRHGDFMERELRVLIGHTPFQVFAGAALGIFIAMVWIMAGEI
jgi:hypothetical protein